MKKRTFATFFVALLILSCQAKKKSESRLDEESVPVNLGHEALPPSLLETGLFQDNDLTRPSAGIRHYQVRVPLWSDGAQKDRFVFVPKDKAIRFNGTKLEFPTGSVFVKHFKSDNDPGVNIETRIIVLNEDSSWSFGSYLWNDDGSTELLDRSRTVNKGGKDYRIPSPKECTSCHRQNTEVLGFVAPQLNRDQQIPALVEAQILDADVDAMLAVKALDEVNDASLGIDQRARSYMHVNCSVCHNPDGPAGANVMDMRLEAEDTKLLSLGKIFPGNPDASILFQRIAAETSRMPPVSIRADAQALEIFRSYIEAMKDESESIDLPIEEPENPDPSDDANQSESGLWGRLAVWLKAL